MGHLRRSAPCPSPVAYAEVRRFRGVAQRASRLCWAACVQSRLAMDLTGRVAEIDQATLAHRFSAPWEDPKRLPWLSTRTSHACNRPMAPERMSEVWHAVGYTAARRLPLPIGDLGDLLLQQLHHDRPVQVRLAGAHAVLVTAYLRARDGTQAVYLMDPSPDRAGGWQALDEDGDGWLDLWVDLAVL